MESEFLDVAFVNFDKAIMHGRLLNGQDEYGCNLEREVEQVLTAEQKERLSQLDFQHHRERFNLLRGFAQ